MNHKSRPAIPRFETPIVETHCHLDYLDQQDLEAVLSRAFEVGVERIITIAVSEDNLDTVRQIADRYSGIWCTQGIHPHEANSWSKRLGLKVREGCEGAKVVALGEIGLDYFYNLSDKNTQSSYSK